MDFVLLNNALIPGDEAKIPVSDRGFRFGDGVFETIRVVAGVPYQFDWHMARLSKGLAAIKIAFDIKPLAAQCRMVLTKNTLQEGLLRIQITRGSGSRGYLPHSHMTPTCVIEALPLPAAPFQPVNLWLSSYEKISPAALPVQYKISQGLNSTLARIEADEHGCFDALMLNHEKNICETASANVFWLAGDILYTPALQCGALEGSVRSAILRLSPWKTQETEAHIDALQKADSVFICNVAWGIVPVAGIKNSKLQWPLHPAIEALQKLWADDLAGITPII